MSSASGSSFESSFLRAFDVAAHSIWDMMFFPHFRLMVGLMPHGLTIWLGGPAAYFVRLTEVVNSTVSQGMLDRTDPRIQNIKAVIKKFQDLKSVGKTFEHVVVFDDLADLDTASLVAEATDILVAGSDTTATTLSVTLHQLTHVPEVYAALKEEIRHAGLRTPEDYDLTHLDQLPYLVSVTKPQTRYLTINNRFNCSLLPSRKPFALRQPSLVDCHVWCRLQSQRQAYYKSTGR